MDMYQNRSQMTTSMMETSVQPTVPLDVVSVPPPRDPFKYTKADDASAVFIALKQCPVCKTQLFADMDTCYNCMYMFGSNPELEARTEQQGKNNAAKRVDLAKNRSTQEFASQPTQAMDPKSFNASWALRSDQPTQPMEEPISDEGYDLQFELDELRRRKMLEEEELAEHEDAAAQSCGGEYCAMCERSKDRSPDTKAAIVDRKEEAMANDRGSNTDTEKNHQKEATQEILFGEFLIEFGSFLRKFIDDREVGV